MFMRKFLCLFGVPGIVTISLSMTLAQALAEQGPDLGIEATPAQITAWDISIAPDGEGLPEGSGTARQGKAVYAMQCIACHGQEGSGKPNNRLVGGHGSLSSPVPVKTVGSYWPYATTVFDYIRRAMPYTLSGSLTDGEVYAVTAYLLFLNGIVKEDDVIDAQTLPQVQMPNRDNFVLAYPRNPDR